MVFFCGVISGLASCKLVCSVEQQQSVRITILRASIFSHHFGINVLSRARLALITTSTDIISNSQLDFQNRHISQRQLETLVCSSCQSLIQRATKIDVSLRKRQLYVLEFVSVSCGCTSRPPETMHVLRERE